MKIFAEKIKKSKKTDKAYLRQSLLLKADMTGCSVEFPQCGDKKKYIDDKENVIDVEFIF